VIRLTVPGKPHPAARPRFARIGNGVRTFPGKGDGLAKARVKAAWMAAGQPTVTGPFACHIEIVAARPKSHWVKGGLSAAGRKSVTPSGDLDNFAKIPLDALVEAGAIPDDRYCVALAVTKRWSADRDATGHLEIVVAAG